MLSATAEMGQPSMARVPPPRSDGLAYTRPTSYSLVTEARYFSQASCANPRRTLSGMIFCAISDSDHNPAWRKTQVPKAQNLRTIHTFLCANACFRPTTRSRDTLPIQLRPSRAFVGDSL